MTKPYGTFLTALFCTFVGGMLLVSIILPDRASSELENRSLQQAPTLTLNALTDGKFMSEAEKYAADQIALRDFWVALKAWCERLSGKRENNGVYFGREDTLISRLDEPDSAKPDRDVGYLNQLVDNVPVPVFFGLIPTSAAVWRDRLPQGAPTADEKAIIDRLYAGTSAGTVDLYSALSAHAREDIYYRTDHHWTSLGAYYGYAALMEFMGLEAVSLDELAPATVSEDFYGTLYSTSGVRWVKPDSIQVYVPGDGAEVTAYHTGRPEKGNLYVNRYLETKDKYAYFLGGMQPLCVIRTQKTGVPKLLVVRDSYSDSLAPFLTESFSEIHLWDCRSNLDSLKTYVEENHIDRVLILYSLSNFLSDQNLFLLAR